jgi:chitodextrinase
MARCLPLRSTRPRPSLPTMKKRFLFTALALVWMFAPLTLLAAPTISYVQGTYSTPQSPQTAVSAGFNAAQNAGDLNVVIVGWNSGTTAISIVTDTRGNIYVLGAGPTTISGTASQSVYYSRNIAAAAAGTNIVTVRFTAAVAYPDVRILEYAGADPSNPVDVKAERTGSGSTSSNLAAMTTNATDLLVGANYVGSMTSSPGSGFTKRLLTQDGSIAEDRMVTATGNYSATAPLSSSSWWIMQMVAFRADATPPVAPPSLTATTAAVSQINLNWTASTDNAATTGYLVERCQGAGCTNFAQITTATNTTYANTGLTTNTNYSYRVRAKDAAGNLSPYSSTASATTLAPLTAPSNLTATPIGPNQVALSWTAATSTPGIASYVVQRCLGTSCSNFLLIATPTGASLADSGLSPSTTYRYRVQAVDVAGSASSWSGIVSATTNALPSPPPSAPGNLTAASAGVGQITLNWTASNSSVGIANYVVQRCQGAGCVTFLQIATPAVTSYDDVGLLPSTSYSYRVQAVDTAGATGPVSNSASATTDALPSPPPTAPGNVTAMATSAHQITVSWTASTSAVAGIANYVVRRCQGTGCTTFTHVASPIDTTYADASVAPSTPYSYVVVAVDTAGVTSVTSNVASATTSATPALSPYTTNFGLIENPIAEGGNWVNGKTVGVDWHDVRTNGALAYGTQDGSSNYDDSIAILGGAWGATQTVEATVHTVNQQSGGVYEEVELLLRFAISGLVARGYEINFACRSGSDAYTEIVRWNGALGSFTYLSQLSGPGLRDGDVVKATISGATISTYINNVLIATATDNTWAGGAPGMGFYLQGGTSTLASDYGFTSLTASDGSTTVDALPPSGPTNLVSTAILPSQIDLGWTASTDNVGVSGYQVFRDGTPVATTTAAAFSDNGLASSSSYMYTVSAFDAAGNTSIPSAPLSVTTTATDAMAPSMPTGLQSLNVTSGSLILTWAPSTDNVAVAGYRVFRDGIQVATTAAASYSDSGLAPLTTYAYTVSAYDSSNNVSLETQPTFVTTAPRPTSPPSVVQVNQSQISSGKSTSVAFKAAATVGRTIVAYVIWNNAGSVTLTDSRGDAFVSVSSPTAWGSGYRAQVFYATNIAGGATTVTATFQTSVTAFGILYVHEYAGISPVNPVDATAAASGSSSSLNSGNVTTTGANDLLFGAGVSDSSVTAAGTGFAVRNMSYGNITEDKVGSSAGSYSAGATHSGSKWAMQVVAFRAAN